MLLLILLDLLSLEDSIIIPLLQSLLCEIFFYELNNKIVNYSIRNADNKEMKQFPIP